ncbi:MAG: phosphoserine phosphatase SerB [Halocynthiibacter sp.]
MTSYALVLIANSSSGPLKRAQIDRVCEICGEVRVDWLAQDEACDIYFDSSLSSAELTRRARLTLSGTSVDVVCIAVQGRRKKILVSDMDSTVINQECIDELGDAVGVGAKVKAVTADVINGDISFSEALRKRLALMKGMDFSVLVRVYEERITLQPGARVFVQTMRHHGAHCVLVSGGFSFFTSRIAERIGFHDHHGNELAFANGKLTGEIIEPILGRSAKLDTLKSLCAAGGLDLSDALAVGDGANDIKMIEAAGLGIAYHGSDLLRKKASACVDHGDLTALLYIQGFRKSEFVLS